MGRPKVPKEKQRKMIAVSLSPEALERVKEYQTEHIKAHGYRIGRSMAVEALIMWPFNKDHFS
jgi:hypothetical protein